MTKALLALLSPLLPIIWIWGGGAAPPAGYCDSVPANAIYCFDFESGTQDCSDTFTTSPSSNVSEVFCNAAGLGGSTYAAEISNGATATATCDISNSCFNDGVSLPANGATYCHRMLIKIQDPSAWVTLDKLMHWGGVSLYNIGYNGDPGPYAFRNSLSNFSNSTRSNSYAPDTEMWLCVQFTVENPGTNDTQRLYALEDCSDYLSGQVQQDLFSAPGSFAIAPQGSTLGEEPGPDAAISTSSFDNATLHAGTCASVWGP